MPICENCNTTFQAPAGPVEVTSARILCPKCEAEHRAAKLARAAARAAPAVESRSSTPSPATRGKADAARAIAVPPVRTSPEKRGATPVPASHPPARPAAPHVTTRPVEIDGKVAGSRGAPGPAHAAGHPSGNSLHLPTKNDSTTRVPGRGQQVPASKSELRAHVRPVPAAEPPHKGGKQAGKQGAPSEPAKHHRSKDVERGSELLKQRANRAVVIGWIVAGVLIALAGGVVFKVKSQKDAENARIAADRKEREDFLRGLRAFDIAVEEDAAKAVEFAESKASIWRGTTDEPDVSSLIAKSKTNLEAAQEKRALAKRLADVEEALAAPETQSADQLAEARRNIEELEPKAPLVGSEFVARLGTARATVDRVYSDKLHEEAKTAAEADDLRGALVKYTRAEDAIVPLFDKSIKDQDKEAREFFEGHYRAIINESDVLVQRIFTPEVIEQLPWVDLLGGESVARWAGSKDVKGFEYHIDKGVLHLHGSDPDASGLGAVSIGETEKWRDFVIELEFTLSGGSVQLYLRAPRTIDKNVEAVTIDTQGSGAVAADESYAAELSFIGSDLKFIVQSVEVNPIETVVSWTKTRKGALVIVPAEAAVLKFTKMRVKVLR